jgi:hypothetical protein
MTTVYLDPAMVPASLRGGYSGKQFKGGKRPEARLFRHSFLRADAQCTNIRAVADRIGRKPYFQSRAARSHLTAPVTNDLPGLIASRTVASKHSRLAKSKAL